MLKSKMDYYQFLADYLLMKHYSIPCIHAVPDEKVEESALGIGLGGRCLPGNGDHESL